MAHTLASPCLGHEPKAKVVTTKHKMGFITKASVAKLGPNLIICRFKVRTNGVMTLTLGPRIMQRHGKVWVKNVT